MEKLDIVNIDQLNEIEQSIKDFTLLKKNGEQIKLKTIHFKNLNETEWEKKFHNKDFIVPRYHLRHKMVCGEDQISLIVYQCI